jgi:hypothetical protein
MGTEPLNDVLARFREVAPAVRGCAFLQNGELAAATGKDDGWLEGASALLAAADRAAGAEASHVHVATEAGEVYAVRSGAYAMVAVTDRFALASLTLADMRATLRTVATRGAERVEAAA